VGEQNGLNKTAAPSATESSQPREIFLPNFQTILVMIIQETNWYVQRGAQARDKPDIPHSQQISVKDLDAYLTIIVQMGYYHKNIVMLCDHFLMILKHLSFVDRYNP
jgi:hypothetical protein